MKTIILSILFFFSIQILSSQTWLLPHQNIVLPNVPSESAIGKTIGANGGNYIGTNGLPEPGVINSLRDFYHMEIDYKYGYFPSEKKLNANTCDCSNTWCNTGDCDEVTNPNSGKSGFSSKKGFYCKWSGSNYQFEEVYASLEALFIKNEGKSTCANQTITRSYPDKWYSLEEWGGINNIEQNFAGYLIPFLETYAPNDLSRPALIDVLEIGNEPWGNPFPGREGYAKMLRSTINVFKNYYGPDKADWRLKLSTAAFIAHDDNPNHYGATEKYIEDMFPADVRSYFDYVAIHPYANPIDNSYFGVGERPEGHNSEFLFFKNLIDWKNQNMPHGKVNITEFGWNSGSHGDGCSSLGESSQAAYIMRAYLLANRYNVNKSFVYAFSDSWEYPQYCTTGIYNDLDNNDPKKAFKSLKKLQNSDLSDKRFLKAIMEVDDDLNGGANGVYAYIFGDENGFPTHLVAWKPTDLDFEDNTYPIFSSLATTISLPDTRMTLKSEEAYYYLGWDNSFDDYSENNPNALVTNVVGNKSDINVKLSGLPVVIPINDGGCWYDAEGNKHCDDFQTGLNDFLTTKNKGFTLFPNPAQNELYIQMNEGRIISSVEIFDTSGKKVISNTLDNSQTMIYFAISNLDKGTYQIRLVSEDLILRKQFVKI